MQHCHLLDNERMQHLSKSNVYDMGQLERTLFRESAWPVSIAAMSRILAILNIKL